jgi:diaminopimelate decarboxylase
VPYVEGEFAPSITEWADTVKKAAAAAGIPESTRITAEPGRSLVAPTAITVYRVGTIKELPGIRTYLSVNGGMSDNPRPVLYGSGYEAFLPRDVDAERTFNCRIVGKHCESGDVLIESAWLPESVEVGDLLATPVTGAYGYSMASNYNRILRPPVVFATDGRAEVAVRRETYEDLVKLDA